VQAELDFLICPKFWTLLFLCESILDLLPQKVAFELLDDLRIFGSFKVVVCIGVFACMVMLAFSLSLDYSNMQVSFYIWV